MGFVSVIAVFIEMVYLDQKNKFLFVYQNIFKLRQCLNQFNFVSVRIMWINSFGWFDYFKEFIVNYFVFLFNKSDKFLEGYVEVVNIKEELFEENENSWFFIINKRKSISKRSRLIVNMYIDVKLSIKVLVKVKRSWFNQIKI